MQDVADKIKKLRKDTTKQIEKLQNDMQEKTMNILIASIKSARTDPNISLEDVIFLVNKALPKWWMFLSDSGLQLQETGGRGSIYSYDYCGILSLFGKVENWNDDDQCRLDDVWKEKMGDIHVYKFDGFTQRYK